MGEEENRRSVDIFESDRNLLFPGKANYHWLNGDYPVIILSTTHPARVMRVEAFVPASDFATLLRIKQGENENDAIRNRISDFDKRRISQPKTQ